MTLAFGCDVTTPVHAFRVSFRVLYDWSGVLKYIVLAGACSMDIVAVNRGRSGDWGDVLKIKRSIKLSLSCKLG